MRENYLNEVNFQSGNTALFEFTSSKGYKDYYMNEYDFYDGEYYTTFNIVEINTVKNKIQVAVSCTGKLSVQAFDLLLNNKGYYFEYGMCLTKIFIDDFEQVTEGEF